MLVQMIMMKAYFMRMKIVSSIISLNTDSEFFRDKLKTLRLSNVDRIMVAQINVNSIRNKFDALMTGIQNKVDILFISETNSH